MPVPTPMCSVAAPMAAHWATESLVCTRSTSMTRWKPAVSTR